MPILTGQKSEQSRSITITTSTPTVWRHSKNCIKNSWLWSFFPLTFSEIYLFFLSFISPPCRKHKVCHIHWTIPAFFFPGLTGWAADPRPTCRWHSRGRCYHAGRAWESLSAKFRRAVQYKKNRDAGPSASKNEDNLSALKNIIVY